mmetsp:Transcript_7090/g.17592  ORF Transcript_7090/g.17592 Transcript_7090/m.17592 type:complete len:538 (+) Transcript_7090:3-1616(+)
MMGIPPLPLIVLLSELCHVASSESSHISLLQHFAKPTSPSTQRGYQQASSLPGVAFQKHEALVTTENVVVGDDAMFALGAKMASSAPSSGVGFVNSNTSPEATRMLHANTPWVINATICSMLFGVVVITAIGCILGGQKWVAAMVLASYAILIPGLFSKDFSFNIAAVISGIPLLGDERFQITAPRGHKGPIRESTRSVVPLLWDTGSRSGAILIAIFAFVVPVLKLVLLGLGELWRHSQEAWKVRTARRSILAVQIVSKWASPDMFAFALLYYLLRSLHHPPILESIQVLDIGFSCYNLFCVSSVISTMSVKLPKDPDQRKASRAELVARQVGPSTVMPMAVLLFVSWAGFFMKGISTPCLSLRLDVDTIMKALSLPTSFKPIVEMFDVEKLINSKVSLLNATANLWGWFTGSWELNLLLAFVMIGGFGLVLTVMDMLTLLAVALRFWWNGAEAVRDASLASMLHTTHAVKHVAMLDVCTAGVIVVSFAASIYKEQGIMIELAPGIYFLIASEILHYLTFYFVSGYADNMKVTTED